MVSEALRLVLRVGRWNLAFGWEGGWGMVIRWGFRGGRFRPGGLACGVGPGGDETSFLS